MVIGSFLCSHPSLFSLLHLRHLQRHAAYPLWPGWREEIAGPAFLTVSSFHLLGLFPLNYSIYLFI